MATENAEHLIEIRVDRLAQLFHTLDPFPFWEKDLDQEAEEYIVSWARELPDKRPIRIVVHVRDGDARAANSDELNDGISSLFRGPRCCRPERPQRAVPDRPALAGHRNSDPRRMLRRCTICRRIPACKIRFRGWSKRACLSLAGSRIGGRWRSFSTTGGRWRAGVTCTGAWLPLPLSSGRMPVRVSRSRALAARGSGRF